MMYGNVPVSYCTGKYLCWCTKADGNTTLPFFIHALCLPPFVAGRNSRSFYYFFLFLSNESSADYDSRARLIIIRVKVDGRPLIHEFLRTI